MMKEVTCGEAKHMASDLIDGELRPEDAARLQAHIESCPTCPRLYRALVAVTPS
jgi:RNA polymerase sigma-70 factor (ECF subfamily)